MRMVVLFLRVLCRGVQAVHGPGSPESIPRSHIL
ncbi:hypothetical protein BIW11_07737 [Tropilaelaps mercedesae]|uniref:Uncharacterized protein n=1 Tax=Tropilaelaps mercedesae TaxID=418985 RepID=A0A1V9XSU7_9ACAR|nr:hypothetical protein BIW11_07737 [Tropilaelaps mercedesae]